ncbi:MAG: hypothetical protein FWD69_14565 [Polyangiaceae bacterium]|nr:hypothetical protein [Polyangiaceae bacterium]
MKAHFRFDAISSLGPALRSSKPKGCSGPLLGPASTSRQIDCGLRWIILLVISLCLVACGGKEGEGAKVPAAESDALALLPGNAIGLGTVDARAFFGSQTFGADLAKLVEKYMPIGPESGFQASRDVDRVTFGSYSYQGVDVAAIVVGRFDEAKIKQAATNPTATKTGFVASQYAGHDIFTTNNAGFTLLSDTMAIAGTESGIRRVLERIQDRRVKRDVAPWMIQTVETPGAAFAVAGDFTTNPLPPDVMRQIPIPFMQNLRAARVVGTFKDQAVQLAGSMTYPDGASAESASQSVSKTLAMSKLFSIFGIKILASDVKVDASDVQIMLRVDDQSLRQLLASAPLWLGQ